MVRCCVDLSRDESNLVRVRVFVCVRARACVSCVCMRVRVHAHTHRCKEITRTRVFTVTENPAAAGHAELARLACASTHFFILIPGVATQPATGLQEPTTPETPNPQTQSPEL
jgi:hypothetical protein